MRTVVYLNKQGERVAVYHRTDGGRDSWEHPWGDACGACAVISKDKRKVAQVLTVYQGEGEEEEG